MFEYPPIVGPCFMSRLATYTISTAGVCEVQSSALEATMLTLPSSSQGQIILALGPKYKFYPLAVKAPHILFLLRGGGVVY